MRDLISRTLGHYRIVEKIGEGGMGEVYRANDERLDRDVAVKVLPEAVAGVQDRLERFEREAKLLASLNHPNIATLYGLEEEESQRFLVMELVEGESLASVHSRGALRVDEALPIALQIAKAMETAHEHGVIHRDLKPANVMVDSEGQVKVLDFGLAKAFDPEGSGPQSPESIAESPTITADMTRAGVLLGTAAYMSPEQACGKAVDKRVDIWAFGCVLWEMLTGTRAFAGTTSTEIMAAIIKEEPDWETLSAETPAPVRRLLKRCLTKDPRNRLHDIADIRIELQFLPTDDRYKDEPAVQVSSRSGWRTWLPWGFTAVFAALAVAIPIVLLRSSPSNTVTKMLVDVEPAEWLGSVGKGGWTDEYERLSRTAMALSPDGRILVYSAGDDNGSRLYLRAMGETQAAPITGTEGGVGPFFSPDGEWIGFWADGQLKKVRVDGGPSMPVCDAPSPPCGADWGPDGTIVFDGDQRSISQVSAGGGISQTITVLQEGEVQHLHPQLIDGGQTLLFSTTTGGRSPEEFTIVARSLKTGDRKILVENGADPRYSPSGHLVFVRLGAIMAVPFDLKRLEVEGGAVIVLDSVRQAVNAANTGYNTYCGQFTFSKSGSLVHVPGGIWPDDTAPLFWVDRGGNAEPLPLSPGTYEGARLSPDGSRFVVSTSGFRTQDIWLYEISRGTMTPLTFQESADDWPIWTPDGAKITYSTRSRSSGSNLRSIVSIPADGSGVPRQILAGGDAGGSPASWSPDGQVLAYLHYSDTGGMDIWMLPLGGEPKPFIESSFDEMWPTFSPNGHWLAYGSDQSGRPEVYVTPYPGPGPRIQISSDGGLTPVWAPHGQELFFHGYRDSDGLRAMMVADVSMEPEFTVGNVRRLFTGDYGYSLPLRHYDVTPDGKRFLMGSPHQNSSTPVTHLHLTLNWFDELKRLAPTK